MCVPTNVSENLRTSTGSEFHINRFTIADQEGFVEQIYFQNSSA